MSEPNWPTPQEWLQELESGNRRRLTGRLGVNLGTAGLSDLDSDQCDTAFCCLGVLADMAEVDREEVRNMGLVKSRRLQFNFPSGPAYELIPWGDAPSWLDFALQRKLAKINDSVSSHKDQTFDSVVPAIRQALKEAGLI